ncbi:hypothetical protein BHE74_00027050 [Ensete ventricosum]|nr:hypothetical protein BHE74_00027050 [Ensete ventricosum]
MVETTEAAIEEEMAAFGGSGEEGRLEAIVAQKMAMVGEEDAAGQRQGRKKGQLEKAVAKRWGLSTRLGNGQ